MWMVLLAALASEPVSVDHKAVQWTKQFPKPAYPSTARAKIDVEHVCTADLAFDTNGKISSVTVAGCDTSFIDSTRAAVEQWTAYPQEVNGVRVPFQTRIKVRFESMTPKAFKRLMRERSPTEAR